MGRFTAERSPGHRTVTCRSHLVRATAAALGLRASGQGPDERPRAQLVACYASPESCAFNPETGKSQCGFHRCEKELIQLGPEQNRNLRGGEGQACGRGDRPSAVPEVCPTVEF